MGLFIWGLATYLSIYWIYIRYFKNKKDFIEELSDTLDSANVSFKYVIGNIKLNFFHTEYELQVVAYNDGYYACDKPADLIKYLQGKSNDYKGMLKVLEKNDLGNMEPNVSLKDVKTPSYYRSTWDNVKKAQEIIDSIQTKNDEKFPQSKKLLEDYRSGNIKYGRKISPRVHEIFKKTFQQVDGKIIMPLTPSQIHRHTNIFENESKSALVTASPEELEKCRFTTPIVESKIHEIKSPHRKIYIIGDEDENNEKT